MQPPRRTADPPADIAGSLTPARRAVLTVGIMLATGLQFIDGTFVAVAINHMQGSLSTTPEQISWVATAYLVTAAMFMPLAGWLSGYLGRRRLMLFAVAAFAVLPMATGAAGSLEQMIPLRIVLGLCGAILVPLSQAAMLDIYPREKHGMAIGLWGIATTLGPALAPIMGGWLADAYSWRWAFYAIAPFSIAAFLILLPMLPEGIRQGQRRFDMAGFVLLTVSVGAMQLMINRGEREDWFASTEIVVEAAIAAVGFYMFVVHAFFARQPFLNLALFRDRNYVAGLLLVVMSGPTQFATVLMMPMMVQSIHDYPVLMAGFIMTPRGIGTIVSMAVAGWLTARVDTRVLMIFGFAVLIVANAAVALFGPAVGFWDIVVASFGQGIGMGFTMVPLSVIAYSTLSPALRPEGAALFNLTRMLSGAMSVALIVAILTRTAQITRSTLVEHVSPLRELLYGADVPALWAIEALPGIASLDREIAQQSLMVAFQNSFLVMVIVPALGIVLTLLIGKHRS
jgi:DHA2 family multidrug resistance protein